MEIVRISEYKQDGKTFLLWAFGKEEITPNPRDLENLETGEFVFVDEGVITRIG